MRLKLDLSSLARSLLLLAAVSAGVHAAESRSVDTAFGPVKIDGNPLRVVTLDESALDTALAVGIQPVGTVSTRGSSGISDYLEAKAGNLQIVGTTRAPNLESIFKLKPDLILASASTPRDLYTSYSALAPTIVPKTDSSDWQAGTRTYAHALGRDSQADAALAAIKARAGALKARIPAGQSVSVVRWMPQGPMTMSSHIFVGSLLQEVGLRGTELAQGLKKPHSDVLSLENLGKIDADWLFIASLNAEGAKTLEEARKQPAFERLQAVQKGRTVTVDGQVWSSGSGPLAANKVLDDVEQALLKP